MLSNTILPFFANYFQQELGLRHTLEEYEGLERRLRSVAEALNDGCLLKLYEQCQNGIRGHLKQLLLDSISDNQAFFSDAGLFRAIEQKVLPVLSEKNGAAKPTPMWVVASASGQDVLSLTMLVHEWQLRTAIRLPFSVVGTDFSELALRRAREAKYSNLDIQRGLPARMMVKYFEKDAELQWQAKPELRHFVDYRKLNRKEPVLWGRKVDLVVCRNVMVCYDEKGGVDILNKISANLNPGGFLVLGSGEKLPAAAHGFEKVPSIDARIYRRI